LLLGLALTVQPSKPGPRAWDASRDFEEPPPSSAKIMRKPLVEREHELLVIAERMFEGY
jgi:hypothetical protein